MVVNGRQQGLDADFARAGLWHRAVAQLEDVGGFTKSGVDGTAHGVSFEFDEGMYQASCCSSAWAQAAELPGFWPVTRRPSVTTYDCQSGPFS
ncbi:hypothetical protein D3C85_1537280 [compost metagenome]